MVSNFNVRHLEALEVSGRPLPVANQIEVHPLNYESFGMKQVVEWCNSRGILVQAYGSLLTAGQRVGQSDVRPSLFAAGKPWFWESPVLTGIVAAHAGKSAPQVLLRWALQKGFQLLIMTGKKERMEENKALF